MDDNSFTCEWGNKDNCPSISFDKLPDFENEGRIISTKEESKILSDH